MQRGLLGARPNSSPSLDGNKRKRDARSQYIASMLQGNAKMLLADSPLFEGLTQHQLPFTVTRLGFSPEPHYQARIPLPLPDGTEAWGVGVARTKKEAERIAAVDSCKQLNDLGLLVGASKGTLPNSGWGDNPKNTLVTSVAFRDICCGGNARALPITLRASGPDHAKVFIAELAVPFSNREFFVAVGHGHNKSEAERVCCTAACEKLHQEGLLHKPGSHGERTNPMSTPSSGKTLLIQQQNEQPSVIALRDEELVMMEDALQRLHLEMQDVFSQGIYQIFPIVEAQNYDMQRETPEVTTESMSREHLATENVMLQLEARKRMTSTEYIEQRQARQSLPSWKERQKIVDTIYNNRVVVLTGETGCGKTTQVPQFVLEDAELKCAGAQVHIVVTQPRRIAAISVAERVAWERGESVGKSVGYTIRLESVPPRLCGSILYCTTGILLRRLHKSDGLAGVTHIVIDEVHERDLDTDFLLVVVRELLQHYPSLRVIIMSATLDASIYTRMAQRHGELELHELKKKQKE